MAARLPRPRMARGTCIFRDGPAPEARRGVERIPARFPRELPDHADDAGAGATRGAVADRTLLRMVRWRVPCARWRGGDRASVRKRPRQRVWGIRVHEHRFLVLPRMASCER